MIEQMTQRGPQGLNDLGLPGRPEDTRIVVAMSGGVDSSVTAAELARRGYDVVGITLQLYDHGAAVARKGACCAGQDIHDARQVAEKIGIPHYVLNYEDRFRASVIDDFADSYIAGETPIPCVRCNERVKFRDMLETAKELGAQALATGHYISWRQGHGGAQMHRAADPDKDQSYFLFTTTPEQLAFLRFPLGAMTKAQVRARAEELGLAVAAKPDSQDICFVPTGGYAQLVERLRPEAAEPGEIVHLDGRVLGTHQGIINYTIGQRRGLGVADGAPLYVAKIDPAARRVYVGPPSALETVNILLRQVNWLGDGPLEALPGDGLPILAKVRSTRPPAPARLFWVDGAARVVLDEPETGVAAGQACVFYEVGSTRVLGGGWIAKAVARFEEKSGDRAAQRPQAAAG